MTKKRQKKKPFTRKEEINDEKRKNGKDEERLKNVIYDEERFVCSEE